MSENPPPAQPFVNRYLFLKVGFMTPIVQWLFLVYISIFSDKEHIICMNWHGVGTKCSVLVMLYASAFNVLLLNLSTVGLAFLVAFIVTFCLFLLYSAFVPPAVGRSRVFWGGLATVFVAILAFRSMQTTEFGDGRDEWMKDPPIIIESPGGVGEVVPPISPTTGSQPSQRSKE